MQPKLNLILSKYRITKMDCPSEEQMIRMKLESLEGIRRLEFDIPNRLLSVYHLGEHNEISKNIDDLNLGSDRLESFVIDDQPHPETNDMKEKKILWIVLIINFGFFVLEMSAGVISKSMGLVADSLDMFADAAVYGLSLMAVGKALSKKKFVAKIAGYFQLTLAIIGFVEVVRRFLGFEELPVFQTMIIVSIFALIGNAISLYLLQKSKSQDAHMKASMIFTSNDIIINGGVIVAAIFVSLLNSKIPDLIIGAIIFTIVINGSFRILKLAK